MKKNYISTQGDLDWKIDVKIECFWKLLFLWLGLSKTYFLKNWEYRKSLVKKFKKSFFEEYTYLCRKIWKTIISNMLASVLPKTHDFANQFFNNHQWTDKSKNFNRAKSKCSNK